MFDPASASASDPLAPLVEFGRDLRGRGLPVGTGRILTFCRAVAALGLADRESLYWAGRASLVARHGDIGTFDVAFDDWYRSSGRGEGPRIELTIPSADTQRPPADWGERPDDLEITTGSTAAGWKALSDEDEEPEPGDETAIRIVASAVEVLREKS